MSLLDLFHCQAANTVEESSVPDFQKWIPFSIVEEENQLSIRWQNMEEFRLTRPFFIDSLRSIPYERRTHCKTSLAPLAALKKSRCIQPTAFLFHSSRCGSTLWSQLLSSLPQCIVLSEPPAVDSALQLISMESYHQLAPTLFQQILLALGQRRFPEESHLFVKFDCWHIHDIDFIQSLYPEVPCFFLYRSPIEILQSHHRKPGVQMVPGILPPDRLNIPAEEVDFVYHCNYTTRVLLEFYKKALEMSRSNRLELVNYTQLPNFVWDSFLQKVGIILEGADLEKLKAKLKATSKRDAKDPQSQFKPQPTITIPNLDGDLFQKLFEQYTELETARCSS